MQRRAASQIVRGAPAKGRSPGQVTSGQVTSDAHHTRAAGAEVRHLRHTSCRVLLGPVPLARDSAHDKQREMVSPRDSRRGIPTCGLSFRMVSSTFHSVGQAIRSMSHAQMVLMASAASTPSFRLPASAGWARKR